MNTLTLKTPPMASPDDVYGNLGEWDALDAWLRENASHLLKHMHARPTAKHGTLATFPLDVAIWLRTQKDFPESVSQLMTRIRLATTDDMDEVMKLAIMAAKENGLLKFEPELLVRTIWPKLNLQSGLIGCIGPVGGKIEGMVVLQIGKLFYSDEQALEELVLYVHPDHRGARGSRAHKLIEFSVKSAEKLGLPLLIGVLSSVQTEAKRKLYERVLGKPSGNYWIVGRKTGTFAEGAA